MKWAAAGFEVAKGDLGCGESRPDAGLEGHLQALGGGGDREGAGEELRAGR